MFTGGAGLRQGYHALSGSAGYVEMEDKIICGDFWDFNAASVACREMKLGQPKDVFGDSRYGIPAADYLDVIPICDGNEESLDSCKVAINTDGCSSAAGVVCKRVTIEDGVTMFDGLPVCAKNFGDTEASAICKEIGYKDGESSQDTSDDNLSTGWSIQCDTGNLENCRKSVCTNSTFAAYTCGDVSEIQLFGGRAPGQGHVLYKGGLVCDDSWDILVGISPI